MPRVVIDTLEGNAEYVVSGDLHLLEIKEYHGVQIISPNRFLDLLPAVAKQDEQ